ncbi:MAG: hypothetical protein ACD_79C00770G0005 [uncultured bacterium]|nr:MAG: hypothetical protein ACD_79C00770G0005 [uncultured bacterium]
MKSRIIFIALFMILFNSYGKDLIERFDDDTYVNWTAGEVCATGVGILTSTKWTMEDKINAHRAASLDALRKLTETIGKIYVDSDVKISTFYENDNIFKKKIDGIVRNFSEKKVNFTDDGVCKVEISVPINGDGSIADVFLGGQDIPKVEDFADKNKVVTNEASSPSVTTEPVKKVEMASIPQKEEPQVNPSIDASIKSSQDGDTKPEETKIAQISGLVINAAGLDVRPALNPKIVSETGEEFYGFNKADKDFRRLNGLASYAVNMDDACLDKRVIETPFTMEAKGVVEGKPATIIVNSKDIEKFSRLDGNTRILNHCRVIIVTQDEKQQST